jgi:hypothetical protein
VAASPSAAGDRASRHPTCEPRCEADAPSCALGVVAARSRTSSSTSRAAVVTTMGRPIVQRVVGGPANARPQKVPGDEGTRTTDLLRARSPPRTWCSEPSRGGPRGGVGGSGGDRVILREQASSARSHHDGHHLLLWISSHSCASTWQKLTPTWCAHSSRPSSRRSWVPRSMRSAALPTTMRAPSGPIGATGSAAVLRATRLGTQVIWPNSRR